MDPKPATTSESLQFEHAEPTKERPPLTLCHFCKLPLIETYYKTDKDLVCPECLGKVKEDYFGGSGSRRMVLGTVVGMVAGVVAVAACYGLAAVAGYFGGLSIFVVALAVAAGVALGSDFRGGLPYQLLAVVLACAFIIEARVAALLQQAFTTEMQGVELTWGELLKLWVLASEEVAAHFPTLLHTDLIFTAVLAFSLYQAWRINGRTEHQISGPFQIALPGLTSDSLPEKKG